MVVLSPELLVLGSHEPAEADPDADAGPDAGPDAGLGTGSDAVHGVARDFAPGVVPDAAAAATGYTDSYQACSSQCPFRGTQSLW